MASSGPLGDARIACLIIDECLNETLFSSRAEAKETLKEWKDDYTHNDHIRVS